MATVRYLVDDVERALEFYVKHLGFTKDEQWGPAFAVVSKDGLTLWLSGPQTSAARPMPDGRIPTPGGWNRIVVEVQDLAATVSSVRTSGVSFRNDIVVGPGGQQILVEDGCGNVVELFQPDP